MFLINSATKGVPVNSKRKKNELVLKILCNLSSPNWLRCCVKRADWRPSTKLKNGIWPQNHNYGLSLPGVEAFEASLGAVFYLIWRGQLKEMVKKRERVTISSPVNPWKGRHFIAMNVKNVRRIVLFTSSLELIRFKVCVCVSLMSICVYGRLFSLNSSYCISVHTFCVRTELVSGWKSLMALSLWLGQVTR